VRVCDTQRPAHSSVRQSSALRIVTIDLSSLSFIADCYRVRPAIHQMLASEGSAFNTDNSVLSVVYDKAKLYPVDPVVNNLEIQ